MNIYNIKYIETQRWSLGLLTQSFGYKPFGTGVSFEPFMTMMTCQEDSAMALGLSVVSENRLG